MRHDRQATCSLPVIELMDSTVPVMVIPRQHLLGTPATYLISWYTALDHPCFATDADRAAIVSLMETVRELAGLRVHGWALTPTTWRILLTHQTHLIASDAALRQQWVACGGARTPIRKPCGSG